MAEIKNSTIPLPEDVIENYRWLDEFLLKLSGTVREFQAEWQAYKYLLGGKMYAYIGMQDKVERPIITMKLDPAYSDIMRGEYDDIIPGYYMNKVHWSTVYLDGEVPNDAILDMASAAHEVVFDSLSKKAQQELGGREL